MNGPSNHDASPPIACDMTDAPDTVAERMAEYAQLFADALLGRDRTEAGIRFRFRADDEIEGKVRDLAAREQACCAFFTFTITRTRDEVHWEAAVVDDDIARAILDQFYLLPDTVPADVEDVHDRFAEAGLRIVIRPC